MTRARLRVNGQAAGQLAYGGFIVTDVAAGDLVVWASAPNPPGNPLVRSCELHLQTPASATVYVDVAPRTASGVAQTVESTGKACGGAFGLRLLDGKEALGRLAGLRLSQQGSDPCPIHPKALIRRPGHATSP